jgi:energy-coupling factor transporter transmembrane protein EcfT
MRYEQAHIHRRGVIYPALSLLLLLLLTSTAAAAQPAPHRAGLVVRWAGNRVGTYVVGFSEDSISGAELLQRAFGNALEMDWQAGGLVAAIGGVGCHPPAEQAFCQCQGGSCTYWRYFHLEGGRWVYSNQGATIYQVHDGDVEGWSWASADTPPPLYTFAQLTAPPTPTLRPPTRTPHPAPTLVPPTAAPGPLTQNSKLKTQNSLLIPILSLIPFVAVALLALGRRARRGYALDSRTWLAWLLGALLLVSVNPYYLLMLLLVCLSVYLTCTSQDGVGMSGGLLLRFGLVITGFVALFNFLTAHYGETVLAHLPQEWPAIGGILTLEGLTAGLLRGLTLLTLLAAFAVFNRVVDHYELLKLTPRLLYRVGLAASVAVAFVPQTLAAASDIGAAQQLRGYRVRTRDLLPLFAPLLTLGLEKAVQMAEALETRAWGYTAPGLSRTRYRHVVLRHADFVVITTALITAALALIARLLGWLPDYSPYPRLSLPDFNPAAMLMLLLLAPAALVLLRRDVQPSVKMRKVYDKV